MLIRKTLAPLSVMLAATTAFSPVMAQTQTGRQLDTFDFTSQETVIVDGQPVTEVGLPGIFWDERCASVEYTFNSAFGANTGLGVFGAEELTPEQLAGAVQDSLDRWNENPSSYIEMNITRIENLGPRLRVGGDFINEVVFVAPFATAATLASSPSTSLNVDTDFVAGDDLDGDGDSDVFDPESVGRNTCFDADGDGDIEFPAGFYKAGTILDNDVQFNQNVFWELEPTDTRPLGPLGNVAFADVDAVSTHEFGHSHGQAHSNLNIISETDGSGTTMFPSIATGSAAAELATRSLHIDDFALSSFIYPEGSSDTGIAALQEGDVAFEDVFDIIEGEVTRADGRGVIGAYVSAIDRASGERVSGVYSGDITLFSDAAGNFVLSDEALLAGLNDGRYEIPVPKAGQYIIDMESLDGSPVFENQVAIRTIVGGFLGDNVFPEEAFNTGQEGAVETQQDFAAPIRAGSSRQINLVVNEETVIPSTDLAVAFIGTGAIAGAQSIQYAQLMDKEAILAALDAGMLPVGANYDTGAFDGATPVYTRAGIALGTLNEDGTIATLTQVLDDVQSFTSDKFVGQRNDFAPAFFRSGLSIRSAITRALRKNPDLEIFVTLDVDQTLPAGPTGFPPHFLALDTAASAASPDFDPTGGAYTSFDGSPLTQRSGNWVVELRFAGQ